MKIQDKNTFDAANIFGLGQENSGYARYFIGTSYLNPLTQPVRAASFSPMSPLSQAAATTGTSIMLPKAAARSSSAPLAVAGIRKRARTR